MALHLGGNLCARRVSWPMALETSGEWVKAATTPDKEPEGWAIPAPGGGELPES